MPHPSPPVDHAAWGARFGWIVGGVLGAFAGFAATYGLERWFFPARVTDPTAAASRAASVLVPLLFFSGALAGHAFGARGGPARYKILGVSAGIALAATGYALLVLTR